MRPLVQIALLATCLQSGIAAAAPGYYWEFGMEMEGLPFSMPKQKVCAPKGSKEPPVTRGDDQCKILEKKLSGKRFQWKAQCKDGLMVGDITSTPTSYSGTLKMTENSGSSMTMKMSGQRLGECDYQDRSGEIQAMQKQAETVVATSCKQALTEMQGAMMGRQCPKETPQYCKRLATLDGYAQATRMPEQIIRMQDEEAANMLAERSAEAAKPCKLDNAKLGTVLCKQAMSQNNFDFVARYCPGDRARLCQPAAAANQIAYVSALCPAERDAWIQANCEGRRYSSEIEPRFRDFCANAGMQADGAHNDAAPSSNSAAPSNPAAATGEATGIVIDQGIKKLRGLFGF